MGDGDERRDRRKQRSERPVEFEPEQFRPVEVNLDDGSWVNGTLEGYRRVEGAWSGFVRYSPSAGQIRFEWFERSRVHGGGLG